MLNIWVSTAPDEPPVAIKGSQDTHTDGTPKTPQNSTFCCICFFVTTSSLIPTFDHPNQNRRGCNCIQSRKVYIYIHMYIFKNINAIKSLQLYRKGSCHSYHEWKLTLNSSKNKCIKKGNLYTGIQSDRSSGVGMKSTIIPLPCPWAFDSVHISLKVSIKRLLLPLFQALGGG